VPCRERVSNRENLASSLQRYCPVNRKSWLQSHQKSHPVESPPHRLHRKRLLRSNLFRMYSNSRRRPQVSHWQIGRWEVARRHLRSAGRRSEKPVHRTTSHRIPSRWILNPQNLRATTLKPAIRKQTFPKRPTRSPILMFQPRLLRPALRRWTKRFQSS